MRKLVYILFFLLLACKSNPIGLQEKINVLFIGNSLTYYHDMPLTLQKMLGEKGLNYDIEQSTFPGMPLSWHLENIITKKEDDGSIYTRVKNEGERTETESKIMSKNWDIIILQEGTFNLYFPEVILEVIQPTIKKIQVLNKNKSCKYIFFNTWIFKNNNYPLNSICLNKHDFDWKKYYVNEEISNKEKFCSLDILNEIDNLRILNESLNPIKDNNNLIITNHPDIHFKIRKFFPEIELYDDDFHPSEVGSFLNACVFYKLLTNKNPKKLKYIGKLTKETAEIIKKESN
jgi:hypothetical protein